jgi:hypothetical protein
MDDLIRYVQRAGIVSALLMVGLLIGLMAPSSSEAGRPIVTLWIDGNYYNLPVGAAGSCNKLQGEESFNACYSIAVGGTFTGGSSRTFTINAIGTPTPRILIQDGTVQNFRLTNLEVAPLQTTFTEEHKIKIYVDVVMDQNTTAVTCTTRTSYSTCLSTSTPSYSLQQKIGGQFNALGGALTHSSLDYVRYGGYGYLTNVTQGSRPIDANGLPLSTYKPPCDEYLATQTDLTKCPNSNPELLDTTKVTKFLQPGTCATGTAAQVTSYYGTPGTTATSTTSTDLNTCELRRQFGTVTAEPGSFSGDPPLPNLTQSSVALKKCITNIGTALTGGSGQCKPRIIEVVRATIKGADSFRLQTTAGACGGACDATNNAGGAQTPNGPPCFANSKKVKSLQNQCLDTFAQQEQAELVFDTLSGASHPPACTENCGCPDTACSGTIVIEMDENPAVAGITFPFIGSGPTITNPGCLTTSPTFSDVFVPDTFCVGPTDSSGVATKTFSNITPTGFDLWTFSVDLTHFPPVPPKNGQTFNGDWKIDSIDCTSQLNQSAITDPNTGEVIQQEVKVSDWTTDSGNPKTAARVTLLGGGDTVKCTFHGHKNSN